MKFYPHRTVDEQSKRLPQALRERYKQTQLDRIKLFDGTKQLDVTGYSDYSFMEEKSYVEQPTRSSDGSIENIEDYETFLTPRLIIKYNMMNIDDYRSLMKMLKNHNAFWLRCYDIVEDKRVTHEMYVAPSSMPKLYQQYLIALGVSDLSIELIGTNNTSYRHSNFSISKQNGSISYSFQKGMTWKDFIENSDDTFTSNKDIVYHENAPIYYNGVHVNVEDFIVYGGVYNI